MTVLRFTGMIPNEEITEFLSNFGYTQVIELNKSQYSGLTTENQFAPEYLHSFKTGEQRIWNPNNGGYQTIPPQDESDFDPYSRVDLTEVWAEKQQKDLTKMKFYLVDNRLLFFWVPRTGRDYFFRAVKRGWRGGEFSKTGGSWFCLHRSPEPDEEGNYPLQFGLPVTYTPVGIIGHDSRSGQLPEIENIEFSDSGPYQRITDGTVSEGIAYNWDFQGGLIYRTYAAEIQSAVRGNRQRIKDNMAWYGGITWSGGGFTQCKFYYPSCATRTINPRNTAAQNQRLSGINSLLKRIGQWQGSNDSVVGREFRATCATEKSLKSLMMIFVEEQTPIRIAYRLPASGYQNQTVFSPMSMAGESGGWGELGLNASTTTARQGGSYGGRPRQTLSDGTQSYAVAMDVEFNPDGCAPIFKGNSVASWKLARSAGQPVSINHIINFNYRLPRILQE